MRSERRLSIDEIAERLAISRSTIYHWVRDIEIPKSEFDARGEGNMSPAAREARRRGNETMRRRFAQKREAAYAKGRAEFRALAKADPVFRDFVTLYVGEGSKRSRDTVSLCNSDPGVVLVAKQVIERFTGRKMNYFVQHHRDQDPRQLCEYWARFLGISESEIRTSLKSNSGQLRGRTRRSPYGVLAVSSHDTCLRSRLQGWIDEMRSSWPKIG